MNGEGWGTWRSRGLFRSRRTYLDTLAIAVWLHGDRTRAEVVKTPASCSPTLPGGHNTCNGVCLAYTTIKAEYAGRYNKALRVCESFFEDKPKGR